MKLYRIRTGQGPGKLDRETFGARFCARFDDPNFDVARDAIAKLEAIAWENYEEGRKAPKTVKAGEGFADPSYELSVEWLDAKKRLAAAQKEHEDDARPRRILVICGSSRNDDTCRRERSERGLERPRPR